MEPRQKKVFHLICSNQRGGREKQDTTLAEGKMEKEQRLDARPISARKKVNKPFEDRGEGE